MKKPVLLGIAQTPKHSVFAVEKKRQGLDATLRFFHELGFASWDTARLLGPIGGGDSGKPTMKYSNTLYEDKFFAIQKGQYNADVFFGKKRIVISIHTIDDERQKLASTILMFCVKLDAK